MVEKCEHCGLQKEQRTIGEETDFQMTLWVAMCDCEERIRMKEEQENKIARDARHRVEYWNKSHVPEEYFYDKLKDWKKISGTDEMYDSARRYCENARDNVFKGQGMLFTGKVGTGKTRLMCYVLRRLMEISLQPVRFLAYNDFAIKLKTTRDNQLQGYINELSRVKILLIDDIGCCQLAEWELPFLSGLVDLRYRDRKRGKVTLFTSMMNIEQLNNRLGADGLGGHLVSRIADMCMGYIVTNTSEVDMRIAKG
jgi:DNA replication protein DnaC